MAFDDAFAQVVSDIGGDWDKWKAALGSKNRAKKESAKYTTRPELQAHWQGEMTPEERESLRTERVKTALSENLLDAARAKELSVQHLFEQVSLKRELHVAAMLLRRGIARVSVGGALAWVKSDQFIRPNPNSRLVTTHEVRDAESEMIRIALAGQGKCEELGGGKEWVIRDPLVSGSEEHSAVVHHVLGSKELVISFRGPAGAGKTELAMETVSAIEALSAKTVMVLAPSSTAVEELTSKGFKNASTLQQFQVNPALQQQVKGQVLWVDEAGFMSVRQLLEVEQFAVAHGCRLIVTGDTKQYHGVERGDALRILEKKGALTQAVLTKIYRQRIPELREAIEDLSKGTVQKTAEGFDKLDKFGVIHEFDDDQVRLRTIADKQIEAWEAKRSSLVIAPTHSECRAVADVVREAMRERGLLSGDEHTVTRLNRLNLSDAQQRDAITYEPGQVIEFHRIAKGCLRAGVKEKKFKSGEQWEVIRREEGAVIVARAGKQKLLPLDEARKFSVFERQEIKVAIGDRVRFTKNVKSCGQKFLNNNLRTVVGIDEGKIMFEKGAIIRNGAGLHIDQGIAITGQASQAKTVDQIIASVPVRSFSQAHQAMFYVMMSRARYVMYLLTDSKVALREAVCRPSKRLSFWEMADGVEKKKALQTEFQRQQAKQQSREQTHER